MGSGGKKNQAASRSDPSLCEGKSGLHVVHGAESNGMETTIGWHGLDTARPNFGGETEGADRFPQEGGLFVLRFGERDLNVWPHKSDRKARKTCSRAKVQQCRRIGVKMTSSEETLPEVAANNLLRIADSGEVRARVPLQQEVKVDGELGKESGRDIRKIGNEEVSNFGFGEGWHRG